MIANKQCSTHFHRHYLIQPYKWMEHYYYSYLQMRNLTHWEFTWLCSCWSSAEPGFNPSSLTPEPCSYFLLLLHRVAVNMQVICSQLWGCCSRVTSDATQLLSLLRGLPEVTRDLKQRSNQYNRTGGGRDQQGQSFPPPWGIEAPGFTELEAKLGGNPRPLSN